MKNLCTLFLLAAFLFSLSPMMAQEDTTVVQAFTFDDITKRRGTFLFPDASKTYRKILMIYTLKCDPATTQDNFDCGEWDYLTYNYVYDKRGIHDSTYQSGPNFRVNGATLDSFLYSTTPVFDIQQQYQYAVNYQDTQSLNDVQVGMGIADLPLFDLAKNESRVQFLWRMDELSAAGLTAGEITSLFLDWSSIGGNMDQFRIKMGHSTMSELPTGQFMEGLSTVYFSNTSVSGIGWQELALPFPFDWNGTDNIVVEFSFEGSGGTLPHTVKAMDAGWNAGNIAQGADYALQFSGGGQYVDLGNGGQVSGANPRTIELWAKADVFNNAGVFQAGPTGTVGKDFSLRTTNTDNLWRVQQWGTPDFDVTLANSKGEWHHYAVTYDGTTTKMYYDGQLAGQEAYNINTGDVSIWLGRWAGSYFNGLIDEVRLWDVALDEATLSDWKHQELNAGHPNYANLLGHYGFNEGSGFLAHDQGPSNQDPGFLINLPWWSKIQADEHFKGIQSTTMRPNMQFRQAVYGTTTIDTQIVNIQIPVKPDLLQMFNNPADGGQIDDDSPIHPSIPTDTTLVWEAGQYSYTYDPEGNVVDSALVVEEASVYSITKEWHSPTVSIEIGRFITPYGIGLSLGSDGTTWIYDVTDYAYLLQDSVELSAGNQQELIDLKFMMIEGTPPENFNGVNRIWGSRRSYSYANLDNDNNLSEVTLSKLPNTERLKVKTRLTGHGHNSNTGSYPHCCEWKDNTHYLFVNGQQAHDWHIWQTHDCALNPVFPQGGTWLGSREGWCPGDVVKDNEFDITDMVTGDDFTLDYDITPVPSNNQGMGNGNYHIAMQLFQFTAPNYNLDAEIYDVISPNNFKIFSRLNPICRDPQIVLRNSGAETLTSVTFTYSVSGGTSETYEWTGSLDFLEEEVVSLPIPSESFWVGDDNHVFSVAVSAPNGATDEHTVNDSYSTVFDLPLTIKTTNRLRFRTNNRPWENTLTIRDMDNNIVLQLDNLDANTTYIEELTDIPMGCYTMQVMDTGNDGLSYWADPAAGVGYVDFLHENFNVAVISFEREFGRTIHFPFFMEEVVSVEKEPLAPATLFELYPNPSTGDFTLELLQIDADAEITIFDAIGQQVHQARILVQGGAYYNLLNLNHLEDGLYFVQVTQDGVTDTQRAIIQRP